MLFHCDLVYAGDNAAFSMPFVNLGLCPEAASSLLVPQMFGYHRAAEALLLGEPFFAEAALDVGLVNRVCHRPRPMASPRAGAQAGRQTGQCADRDQAPHEAGPGPAPIMARMDEEGASFGRMLREPAAREAFWRLHGKAQTRFQQGLRLPVHRRAHRSVVLQGHFYQADACQK
jgi:enoyl-CoA hydratase/carnithine racemase